MTNCRSEGGVRGVVWRTETIRCKRGAKQIMVGRPRKKGRREPNGRIARTYVNPRKQVATQPHRRDVPRHFREWPEAESEFGRLMLNGRITPAQHEAGKRYALLAARFRRVVLSAPSPHAKSIDWTGVLGGYDGEVPDAVVRSIKAEYNAAFEACGEAGNRAQRAVAHYAVLERRVPDPVALEQLRRGLDKLISFWGVDTGLRITTRQK